MPQVQGDSKPTQFSTTSLVGPHVFLILFLALLQKKLFVTSFNLQKWQDEFAPGITDTSDNKHFYTTLH